MRTQKNEIKLTIRLLDARSTTKEIVLTIPLDFEKLAKTSKSQLQTSIETATDKNDALKLKLAEDFSRNIEKNANEIIKIIARRYALLRRNLSTEAKIKLDKLFIEYILSIQRENEIYSNEDKSFLSKEKSSAFQHIKNSLSGVIIAIKFHQNPSLKYDQEVALSLGPKILLASLNELYSGDQRFFREHIKTRSEIATEGGIARTNHYLPLKQKTCELIKAATPPEGWTKELDAYKAVLPMIVSYIKNNNIKRPTIFGIDRLIRRWIKEDPIVSAVIRIANQPSSTIGDN